MESLAGKAGISLRTVFAIERQHVRPQRATRLAIALALGLSVDELPPLNDVDPEVNRVERPRIAEGAATNAP